MKLKKVMALSMAALLTFSVVGCGQKATGNNSEASKAEGTSTAQTKESEAEKSEATGLEDGGLNYADIVLGESFTDVTATIKVLSHRTDLEDTAFPKYVAAFNEMYPNITVEYEASTTYADEALLRIKQSDWDIMMMPAVDKEELSTYFIPYGNLGTMELLVRFANTWLYEDVIYGVPSTGNAQGILYNKAVFEEAGITELPKTPEAFMEALKAIKEKTDVVAPLYTNYAAEWTMGAWDAYIGGSATGDSGYMNQVLIHDPAPFSDNGDDTHAYAVYKILYDAVAEGLTEDDYTTTDWEGSKGMLNRGEIGCMVLGSWAYNQMQDAGDTPEDVGYMSFPITIKGNQYASAGSDYCYGINVQSSEDNQKAAMVYVKWLTEESGFSFSEGGIPIAMDGEYPELYAAFDGIDFIADDAAIAGEETIKNKLNAESELMVNDGGNKKIMELIEHADKGDMTFDEIMESWNTAWNDAQVELDVETK